MNSVVALALLAGSAVASRGSPRCPCVRNVTMPRHKEPFLGNFSDGTPCVLDARTHDGTTSDVCFPVTYGLHRCDTHDLGYDPNCLGTNESAWSEYCAESWCYVDGDKCRDSSYTFWRSSYDYAGGFYWSYDTCGGDSSLWTTDLIVKGLEGKVVRVAFPKSYPPMHYMVDDDGAPINSQVTSMAMAAREKGGVWFKYFDDIRETAGFEWEWTYTSQGALDSVPDGSSWTACAQDVKQGLIDLCIGNFWTTDIRLRTAGFLQPTYSDNFYLIVKRPPARTVINTDIQRAFLKPFSSNLWLALFATIVVMAMTYSWQQGIHKKEKGVTPGQAAGDGELRVVDSAAADDGARRAAPAHRPSLADSHYQGRTQRVLEGFESKHQSARVGHEELENSFHWFYVAAGEIMGGAINLGGQGDVPISIMILKIAWAFFALVVVALYTANLAAMFGQKQAVMHYPISNMDDCISMNPPCTVCGHKVIEDTIKQQYPQVNYKPLATGSSRLIAKMLGTWIPTGNEVGAEADDSTGCDAFVLDEQAYHASHSPELCSWVFVGQVVASLGVSQPVSEEFAASFSYYQKKLVSEDVFANYEAVEIEREHGCVPAEFDLGLPEVDEEAIAVLGVEHLSYLWVFLGCAMSVSLLADGYTRRYMLAKNSYAAVRPVVRRLSSVDGHGSSNEMPPEREDDATSEASA